MRWRDKEDEIGIKSFKMGLEAKNLRVKTAMEKTRKEKRNEEKFYIISEVSRRKIRIRKHRKLPERKCHTEKKSFKLDLEDFPMNFKQYEFTEFGNMAFFNGIVTL